jgi:hypothetical protein
MFQRWSSADAERAVMAARDWLQRLPEEAAGWLAAGTVVALSAMAFLFD